MMPRNAESIFDPSFGGASSPTRSEAERQGTGVPMNVLGLMLNLSMIVSFLGSRSGADVFSLMLKSATTCVRLDEGIEGVGHSSGGGAQGAGGALGAGGGDGGEGWRSGVFDGEEGP